LPHIFVSCREGDKLSEAIDEAASHKKGKVTDTKLTPEQLEEVRSHKKPSDDITREHGCCL
jgi:hypothetical protein